MLRHLPGASPCARLEMVYAESATDQPVVTGSRRQAGRRPDRALRSGFLSRSGRAEAPRRAISPGEALTAPLASSASSPSVTPLLRLLQRELFVMRATAVSYFFQFNLFNIFV